MILISGGAGMVGVPLVKKLISMGNRVRVLTLPDDRAVNHLQEVPCEIVTGDVSHARSLAGIFDGVKTVYHLAAVIIAHDPDIYRRVNSEGTRNMVHGARVSGVGHFIYISSAAVLFHDSTPYAQSKMEGERIVAGQKEMQHTIVRPTLIYGRDGGQEFNMFLEYLRKYPIVPFIGRGKAKKNPIHVDDLVGGLSAIANNPRAFGKIYNLSGGEEISIWDMAQLLLKQQGLSKPVIPIPLWITRILAALFEKTMQNPPLTRYAISRIMQDANLNNEEARKDLGFAPVGFTEGLEKLSR
jgi:NADH dehydrogenase